MLDEARCCPGLHQRNVHLDFICSCARILTAPRCCYAVQVAFILSSASLLWTFSTKSFNVLFTVLPRGWMHVTWGMCSESLLCDLDSGHLLYKCLGPGCALYMHSMLIVFKEGKQVLGMAAEPSACHRTTCASCTFPFHFCHSSLTSSEGEWLPSFPFSCKFRCPFCVFWLSQCAGFWCFWKAGLWRLCKLIKWFSRSWNLQELFHSKKILHSF